MKILGTNAKSVIWSPTYQVPLITLESSYVAERPGAVSTHYSYITEKNNHISAIDLYKAVLGNDLIILHITYELLQ